MGRTVGGLFGGKIAQKFFKLSKKDHQQELFFDVLGLEPVNTTKTGQRAIDKAFIAAYEHESPEVKLFGQYVKIFKLISSYVVGWSKKIGETLDSEADSCLRASFGLVTTRRLCSFSPNLQQIPSRGPLAKYLKRAFAAPYGYLSLAYDLSAHEVRMWANQSGDEALTDAFRAGQKLRKAWIQNPTEDIAKELATKGDIHIVNIHRFFGVWVNKSDPRRSGIKGVVFGVIYGKSAKSVGNDLKKDRLNGVEAQIRDLKKQIAGLKAEIAKVEQDE
jgi:DNA polymerase-1